MALSGSNPFSKSINCSFSASESSKNASPSIPLKQGRLNFSNMNFSNIITRKSSSDEILKFSLSERISLIGSLSFSKKIDENKRF